MEKKAEKYITGFLRKLQKEQKKREGAYFTLASLWNKLYKYVIEIETDKHLYILENNWKEKIKKEVLG